MGQRRSSARRMRSFVNLKYRLGDTTNTPSTSLALRELNTRLISASVVASRSTNFSLRACPARRTSASCRGVTGSNGTDLPAEDVGHRQQYGNDRLPHVSGQ